MTDKLVQKIATDAVYDIVQHIENDEALRAALEARPEDERHDLFQEWEEIIRKNIRAWSD